MKINKAKTTTELQTQLEELYGQRFALKFQKSLGKLETPHTIQQVKKDIARIKTELSVRKLSGEMIKPLNVKSIALPKEEEQVKKTSKKNSKATTKKENIEIKDPSAKIAQTIAIDATPKEENNNDK